MQYQLEPSEYVLARMQVAAASLGGSAIVINPLREDGSPGVPYLAVNVPDGTAWDVVQNAYANARKPRPLYAIYADLNNLTGASKTAIWNDLNSSVVVPGVGTFKKYQLYEGPDDGAVAFGDGIANAAGIPVALRDEMRLRIAMCYVQQYPTYLVNPAFTPPGNTINVPGDEPA